MELPLNYIIEKIYTHGVGPKYKKYSNTYNFGCPICREGNSLHRKRRGFFLVNDGYICCHNCQRTWSPAEWIKEAAGLTYSEILHEAEEYDDCIDEVIQRHGWKEEKRSNPYTLPYDCINLTDSIQVEYYKDNPYVVSALNYIHQRRLDVAINRPKAYYVSLNDKLHRNRLVIPFYDEKGQIVFYQSRALSSQDEKFARYLSKVDAPFSVFGIERIRVNYDYIFLFEGPIDSMFVINGIGMGGLSLNDTQEKQLEKYHFHKKIWVLDNQLDNADVAKKYRQLIEHGESVFVYPEKFKEFKDINDICTAYRLDQISPKFFIDNSFTGMQALLQLGI